MTSILITGLDAVCRRFNIDLMTVVKPATLVVGEEVRDKIAQYPGPAHSPVIWASRKQQKWWFAHRRERGLPPGYTRNSDPESQRLGPSWTVQPTAKGATVGTKVTYAPWAQSATATPFGGPQSAQSKATGWATDESVANDPAINEAAVRAVTQALVHALGG